MIYSYRWKIDGKDIIEPEEAPAHLPSKIREQIAPRQAYVDCPRGAFSGKAVVCVSPEDAESIMAKTSVDITAQLLISSATAGDPVVSETITFPEWTPVESSEVYGVVYITLRDKRVKLERTCINKIWNSVFLVAYEPSGSSTQYTFYERAYCKALNVPYDFEEILDEIFVEAGLDTPSLPFSPDAPDNIHGMGTCAEVISGLLASVGCDLLLDPFTAELTIVRLSDSQELTVLDTAETDGKLIATETIELPEDEKHGHCVVWAADYFPITNIESDTGDFGDGTKSITIVDYALADPTTSKVKTARLTDITQACSDWFLAESDVFKKIFCMVIKQAPGEELRQVTWFLPFKDMLGHTVAINDAVPMPWIKRQEHFYQASISGRTLGSGLGTVVPSRVQYYRNLPGGAFEDSGKEVDAITIGSDIGPYIDIVMWGNDDRWLVVGVCE